MGFYADMRANIQYMDSEGTTYFNIGDEVVCSTGRTKYIGKITQVGTYRNEKEAESFPAIYIDTSMSDTSISGEIILMKDIEYMNKLASENTEQHFKKNFVNMLLDMGYDREFSENIFDRLLRVIYRYNLTISKIIVCIDHAVKNHCNIEDVLKQMCNVDERGIEGELLKVKEECTDIMTETCRGFLDVFVDLMKNEKRENLSADKE